MLRTLRSIIAVLVPLTITVGCASSASSEDEAPAPDVNAESISAQKKKDNQRPPKDYAACYDFYVDQWIECINDAPCRLGDGSCQDFYCPFPVDVIRQDCGGGPRPT